MVYFPQKFLQIELASYQCKSFFERLKSSLAKVSSFLRPKKDLRMIVCGGFFIQNFITEFLKLLVSFEEYYCESYITILKWKIRSVDIESKELQLYVCSVIVQCALNVRDEKFSFLLVLHNFNPV